MVPGLIIGLLVGVGVGIAVALGVRARSQVRLAAEARTAEARLQDANESVRKLSAQLEEVGAALATARSEQARLSAQLDLERRHAEERSASWEQDRQRLEGAFAQLSTEALQKNAEQFLVLADTRWKQAEEAAKGELGKREEAIARLLQPLQETLERYEKGLRQLELDRHGAYRGLTEQVQQLAASQEQLQRETRNLVTALRAPQTRGRWGEMQLRRVVEIAGMLAHCDFEEQVTTYSDDGRLRPDLVVHLPGGGQVVVDAKVPLEAFLQASDADDDESRRAHLVAHSRQLRAHVDRLARREYWQQFERSPEFVVAFVPGDPLLAAAFENDPGLIEHAMASRVLVTTPTTLIALLRTIAHGWREEAMTENAREVQRLGAELYERLGVFARHLSRLHSSLSGTVKAFNDAVGSLESRVLVTARRFPDLGVGQGGKPLPELQPVTAAPRAPQAPEGVTRRLTLARTHEASSFGLLPEPEGPEEGNEESRSGDLGGSGRVAELETRG